MGGAPFPNGAFVRPYRASKSTCTPNKFSKQEILFDELNLDGSCSSPGSPEKDLPLLAALSKEMTDAGGSCLCFVNVQAPRTLAELKDGFYAPDPSGSVDCHCRSRGFSLTAIPKPNDPHPKKGLPFQQHAEPLRYLDAWRTLTRGSMGAFADASK